MVHPNNVRLYPSKSEPSHKPTVNSSYKAYETNTNGGGRKNRSFQNSSSKHQRSLSVFDKTSRCKITKHMGDTNTISQPDLIDI